MRTKNPNENQPPSFLDNFDLFSAQNPASVEGAGTAVSEPSTPPPPPTGLTGTGPMRDLFDFNFRQYSAYVICSRAIPALEDEIGRASCRERV